MKKTSNDLTEEDYNKGWLKLEDIRVLKAEEQSEELTYYGRKDN